RSHCAQCQRYHDSTVIAHLPAEDEEAVRRIVAAARAADELAATAVQLAPQSAWPATARLDSRVLVRLWSCKGCSEGALALERLAGLPDQDSGREVERHPVQREVVRAFLEKWATC